MEKKIDHCVHLQEFLKAQREILLRHIDEHMWCRHIADDQEGKDDFLNVFGWLMRELFCGYACPDRKDCQIAEPFISEDQKPEAPNPP